MCIEHVRSRVFLIKLPAIPAPIGHFVVKNLQDKLITLVDPNLVPGIEVDGFGRLIWTSREGSKFSGSSWNCFFIKSLSKG